MKPILNRDQKDKIRPFLKWPGGKYRLIEQIKALLPPGDCLIEPFVGGGAVFLNTAYPQYVLNDANSDVINVYKILQSEGASFIKSCRAYFKPKYNSEKEYYRLRSQFNECSDLEKRAALFVYLNRHGFNGLCRYNLRKKEFNVPFGRYQNPYFPLEEMQFFHAKSKRAVFISEDYTHTFKFLDKLTDKLFGQFSKKHAIKSPVIYCDPPYVPLSKTASFTAYRGQGFTLEDQKTLASLSLAAAKRNIPVLISNHSNELTRNLYQAAKIKEFQVQRFISCKVLQRKKVKELLAFFW